MDELSIGITGSNGFLGKYLSEYIKKYTNFIVYKFSSKLDSNNPNYYSIGKQINFKTLKKIDLIIHCAHDFKSVDEKFQSNGIQVLLDQINILELNTKILYISTLAAFEKAKSTYGKSKFLCEKIISTHNGIIIKPGIIFGDKNIKGLINKISNFTKKFSFAPYFSNLNSKMYLSHIEDLCKTIVLIINNEKNGIFFCANNNSLSFKDLMIKFSNNKKIILIPVLWQLLYIVLKIAEVIKIKVGFRSDSILSLARQNPRPSENTNTKYSHLFR